MSTADLGRQAPRRVRHQAREAVALMAFSASTSIAIAAALVVVSTLTGQR